MRRLSVVCALVLVVPVIARAQDPVKIDAKHYQVLIDNEKVRVLHALVGPGEKSPMHEHPDHIVIPLANGKGRFTGADGKPVDREMKAETAIWNPAGKPASENSGTTRGDLILVELKGNAAPTATVPPTRPGIKSVRLLENPRADVIRATAETTFAEAPGTTHGYDQVVIALSAAEFHLDVGGKVIDKWKRGDAAFIGRTVKHESKNVGKPVDFIIVAIK